MRRKLAILRKELRIIWPLSMGLCYECGAHQWMWRRPRWYRKHAYVWDKAVPMIGETRHGICKDCGAEDDQDWRLALLDSSFNFLKYLGQPSMRFSSPTIEWTADDMWGKRAD